MMDLSKLNIRPIDELDYDSIREMDFNSFQRKQYRSIENIKNLCSNSPQACLIAFYQEIPIGYIVSHRLGKVGYLGPLGVVKNYQNRGFGEIIVKTAIKILQKTCQFIGLETYPHWGKNIAFFHNLGFREILPSRLMSKKWPTIEKNDSQPFDQPLLLGSQIKKSHWATLINQIRDWKSKGFPPVCLARDVEYFLNYYPNNILFYINETVEAFIAFQSDFSPHHWGAIQPQDNQIQIFNDLIWGVERLNWSDDIKVQFQTHFEQLTKVLLNLGFQLEQDLSCLLYQKEPININQSVDTLSIRAWWG